MHETQAIKSYPFPRNKMAALWLRSSGRCALFVQHDKDCVDCFVLILIKILFPLLLNGKNTLARVATTTRRDEYIPSQPPQKLKVGTRQKILKGDHLVSATFPDGVFHYLHYREHRTGHFLIYLSSTNIVK